MNKNTIIGFLLMLLVLMGYSWYQQQYAVPAVSTTPAPAATQAQQRETQQTSTPTTILADTNAVFFAARADGESSDSLQAIGTVKPVILRNDKLEIRIAPRGGQVEEVRLLHFKSYEDYKNGKDSALLLYRKEDAKLNLTFETKTENIATADYIFTPEQVAPNSVSMVLRGKNGQQIAYDYSLSDDHVLNMKIRTLGMTDQISPNAKHIAVEWSEQVRQQEKGYYFENQYSTLSYKRLDGTAEKLNEQGDETEKAEGAVHWVAFKNQYFSSVLIANQGFDNADFMSKQLDEKTGFLKAYQARMYVKHDYNPATATELQWYFGPNNFRLLQSMEKHNTGAVSFELQDLVYLGWPVIRWINRFFTIYVFDFLTGLNLPMWLVLVLITIILRVVVYAPTRKSFLSSAKMRVLRPKIDALRAKYPNQEDAMKLQQETMMLYSQYGASPLGGCLPMLIQMPIWIAMFNFVPNAIEFRQQSFLWADDLSAFDDLISWNIEIWGLGNHLSLFCVLFCVANVLYTMHTMKQQREQMAATTSPEQAASMKMMQWMMYFMPVMFFFMFNKYSAGLNFYYFLSLFASILTNWYLKYTTDEVKLLAKLEAHYEKNKNKKPSGASGFMARMQALQEQQQKMLEEQRRRNGKQ